MSVLQAYTAWTRDKNLCYGLMVAGGAVAAGLLLRAVKSRA